jgi:hypothetical protein
MEELEKHDEIHNLPIHKQQSIINVCFQVD